MRFLRLQTIHVCFGQVRSCGWLRLGHRRKRKVGKQSSLIEPTRFEFVQTASSWDTLVFRWDISRICISETLLAIFSSVLVFFFVLGPVQSHYLEYKKSLPVLDEKFVENSLMQLRDYHKHWQHKLYSISEHSRSSSRHVRGRCYDSLTRFYFHTVTNPNLRG